MVMVTMMLLDHFVPLHAGPPSPRSRHRRHDIAHDACSVGVPSSVTTEGQASRRTDAAAEGAEQPQDEEGARCEAAAFAVHVLWVGWQ